jgi:hypothetical protein
MKNKWKELFAEAPGSRDNSQWILSWHLTTEDFIPSLLPATAVSLPHCSKYLIIDWSYYANDYNFL